MKKQPKHINKMANTLGLLFVLLSMVCVLVFSLTPTFPHYVIGTFSHLDSKAIALAMFVVLVLISQFLVMPSGSILMVAGGFFLGILPATLIYLSLLPLTGFVIGQITTSTSLRTWIDNWMEKHDTASKITKLLQNEPFTLSAVLRLTPVIPAAVASIIASTLRVRHSTFIFATLCVGWIRPLFFASIGATIQSAQQLQLGSANISGKSVLPLGLLALSVILNLLVRCWLRWKRESSQKIKDAI